MSVRMSVLANIGGNSFSTTLNLSLISCCSAYRSNPSQKPTKGRENSLENFIPIGTKYFPILKKKPNDHSDQRQSIPKIAAPMRWKILCMIVASNTSFGSYEVTIGHKIIMLKNSTCTCHLCNCLLAKELHDISRRGSGPKRMLSWPQFRFSQPF